jgi:RNA polymerase sigma factor (sigma-70 family)
MPLPEYPIESLLLHDRFVRALARRLLSDWHAAEDVSQETWIAALEAGGAAASVPRWLASVVKNLAHKAQRGEQRRKWRERASARPESVPSTRELIEREGARTELVDAVLALEEPYRDAVVLRYFENLSPRAIAKRLGVPVETVRTRLKRALAQLRERLDRKYGEREAWGALLFPLVRHAPLSLGPAFLTVMTLQAKLALASSVVAAVLAALFFWDARRSSSVPLAAASSTQPPASLADVDSPLAQHSAAKEPGVRSEVPSAIEPEPASQALEATGSLLVQVRWHDGSLASGITVQVDSPSVVLGTHSMHMRQAVTSSQGEWRFDGLEPGLVLVVLDRELEDLSSIRIEAGKEARLELTIPRGFDVEGVVLDPFGRPVPGAEVWRFGWGPVESGFLVARTGADGGFEVRSCSTGSLGARAARFAPSLLASLKAADGAGLTLDLVLMGPGGDVRGTVVDPEGHPVGGAFVLVGGGRTPLTYQVTETPVGGSSPIQGFLPGPIESCTDADGAYWIHGVAPGLRPVAVRAEGFAIWRGEVEVFEHGSAILDVRLSPGVDLYGSVVDANGQPVRADVSTGSAFGLLGSETRTAADGSFVLADLEPGEVELRAEGESGRASTKLRGAPGGDLYWEAVLTTGGAIRGRVVDESGIGLAGWSVHIEDDPIVSVDASGVITDFDDKRARTDSDGRFVVEDCRDRSHRVEVNAPGSSFFASASETGVFPGREELELRVESASLPSVRITGVVVDETGQPVGGAQLSPSTQQGGGGIVLTPEVDGSFEFGPYPPGTWSLHVSSTSFPDLVLGPRELFPHDTWECGRIVLQTGGTLLVRLRRDEETKGVAPKLVVRQGAWWRGRLHEEGDHWRSEPLSPGAYRLAARGEGVAARLVPFDIRPGETAEVELPLTQGHAARIRVGTGDLGHRPLLRVVDSSGAIIVDEELWPLEGGGFALDLSLAPGSYRVEASCPAQRAEGNLVVAPEFSSAELALELR